MELYYKVEDKPSPVRALLLAAQHLLAALGGIVAAPIALAIALDLNTPDTVVLVNAGLLVSGLTTILQCQGLGPFGIRLPCLMGATFTFVAVAIAVGQTYGLSGVMGSMLVGSLVPLIGSFFIPQLRRLFPPVVSGTVVMLIGFTLMPITLDWMADYSSLGAGATSIDSLWISGVVILSIIVLSQWGDGFVSTVPVIISILFGYLICWLLGWVDVTPIYQAQVLSIPTPFYFGLSFPLSGIVGMSIAYLVTMMEVTADCIALSNISNIKLTGRKLARGILGVGVGGVLASTFSGTPVASFSQNVGVVAVTRVASRYVVAIAGVLFVLAGLVPIFAALLVSIPKPVLGAVSMVMVGMLIWAGVKILSTVKHNRRNGIIVSVGVSLGICLTLRPDLLSDTPELIRDTLSFGVTTGALVSLLLDQLLPGKPARQG